MLKGHAKKEPVTDSLTVYSLLNTSTDTAPHRPGHSATDLPQDAPKTPPLRIRDVGRLFQATKFMSQLLSEVPVF